VSCILAIEDRSETNGRWMMIARHWKGWTKRENADAYEALLKEKVLPGLRKDSDYRGGYVLRSDGPEETEFVVVNLFDSIEAVRRFAGEDYTVATFEPEAMLLLSRKEAFAMHYEVRVSPATFERRQ
jgi:hypothetical protein